MANGDKGTMMALSKAEHALYFSGVKRGHAECLKQLAGELRLAATNVRTHMVPVGEQRTIAVLADALDKVVAGYDSFAAQLDGPAKSADDEQRKLLDQFCEQKVKAARTLAVRIKAAARGAFEGWRSG